MYEVITLVGSTTLGQEVWDKISADLTLQGNIIFSNNIWDKYDYLHSDEGKEIKLMIDKMVRQKIDISDRVIVIVKNNRLGDSTKEYIKYAKSSMLIVDYIELG